LPEERRQAYERLAVEIFTKYVAAVAYHGVRTAQGFLADGVSTQ
jgi:hypothetical protein